MRIFLSRIVRRLFRIINSNERLREIIIRLLLKLNLYDSLKRIYTKSSKSVYVHKTPESQSSLATGKNIVIEHNLSEQTQRMFEILRNNKE